MPVPDLPGAAQWHEGSPGPNCSVEDLRWFTIREMGKIHEIPRATGRLLHAMQVEINSLKAQAGTKAEAHLVVTELDKLRQDAEVDFTKVRAELDRTALKRR